MSNNEKFDEICRTFKITDYLEARGVNLIKTGQRVRCLCPLPVHPGDSDPSFYISEKPNGVQLFKCFGCGEGGNVFKLVSLIEDKRMGAVVRTLSRETGVRLDAKMSHGFVPNPHQDEVIGSFCDEDEAAKIIAAYAMAFMEAHGGSEDVVNKASKAYRFMDGLVEAGDKQVLASTKDLMITSVLSYQ
jgi:DNA primase